MKSGSAYKEHAALNYVLETEQWNLQEAVVFCKGNIENVQKISYLPWYMSMFLKPDKIERGLIVDVDLGGLK